MRADHVRQIRNALDLTQEQLATELGVSFVTVNRWENGKGISPMGKRLIVQLMNDKGLFLGPDGGIHKRRKKNRKR